MKIKHKIDTYIINAVNKRYKFFLLKTTVLTCLFIYKPFYIQQLDIFATLFYNNNKNHKVTCIYIASDYSIRTSLYRKFPQKY